MKFSFLRIFKCQKQSSAQHFKENVNTLIMEKPYRCHRYAIIISVKINNEQCLKVLEKITLSLKNTPFQVKIIHRIEIYFVKSTVVNVSFIR